MLVAGLIGIGWMSVGGSAQESRLPQSAIDGVIAADAKVERVIGGDYRGLEGPVATPDGGLFVSEIQANRIHVLDKNGSVRVWRENTQGVNGLFLAKDGLLIGAEQGGKRIVAMAPDGRVTSLVSEFGGKPLRSPNDLVQDKRGGIYFTDPARLPPDPMQAPSRVLYRRPGGEVLLVDDVMLFPNGITLSLDERTLYVDDSDGHYVFAFDIQPDGRVKNKRAFVQLHDPIESDRGLRSRADGMAIDSKGRVYVATGSGVQVVDRRGEYLGTIRVPELVRGLAFGGPGRQTLYMAAAPSLYQVRVLTEGPSQRAK